MVKVASSLVSIILSSVAVTSVTSSSSESALRKNTFTHDEEVQSLTSNIFSKSNRRKASFADESMMLDTSTDDQDQYQDDDDYMAIFDLSKYSVKFHSCASLSSFDFEDFAHEEKESRSNSTFNPIEGTQIVTYRLCPSDSCNDDSWEGCSTEYGNNAITLKDYFQAKKEYEESAEEAIESNCNYCESCRFSKKFNEQCGDYYDTCSNKYSESSCKKYSKQQDKSRHDIDYSKYVSCTKVDVKDQRRGKKKRNKRDSILKEWEKAGKVYLKVYCEGSLKVGIFSDDKCSTYIGDQVDIKTITDLSIEENDLKNEFKDKECIACAENKFGSDFNDTSDMCEDLYKDSAKCNGRLSIDDTSWKDDEKEYWFEESLSESTCSIIENIQADKIDENGYVSNTGYAFDTLSPTASPTLNPTERFAISTFSPTNLMTESKNITSSSSEEIDSNAYTSYYTNSGSNGYTPYYKNSGSNTYTSHTNSKESQDGDEVIYFFAGMIVYFACYFIYVCFLRTEEPAMNDGKGGDSYDDYDDYDDYDNSYVRSEG